MASDKRARRTTELLRATLEDLAGHTSADLYERLAAINGPYTMSMTGLGSPEVCAAIREWRESAAAQVALAFKKLHELLKSTEATEKLVWDAIDGAFDWSAPYRRNSRIFSQWLHRAGVDDNIEGLKLRSDKCDQYLDLADQLNCDFCTLFELRIAQVAEELDHARGEPGDADPLSPPAPQRDPNLDLDGEVRERARAKLVDKVRYELATIRPDPSEKADIETLAQEHPDFLIFQKKAQKSLKEWIKRPKYYREYSFILAARLEGHVTGSSMKTAWKKYHKKL